LQLKVKTIQQKTTNASDTSLNFFDFEGFPCIT
jgi:hypothetical protein